MIIYFLGLCVKSMGAYEGPFNVELGNVNFGGCVDLLGVEEQQPETIAIEEAVRILLQGLGEDVNREGIRKTPLRVAKALLEGTRGDDWFFFAFLLLVLFIQLFALLLEMCVPYYACFVLQKYMWFVLHFMVLFFSICFSARQITAITFLHFIMVLSYI